MPTSTRQILCEFIRADVGIRPYDADFNTSLNYNLYMNINWDFVGVGVLDDPLIYA